MPQISIGVWSHYTSFLITWCINQSTPAHVDICCLWYILPICVCDGALSSKNSQHYQQIVRIYKRTLPPRDVRLVDYWHSIWRMVWEGSLELRLRFRPSPLSHLHVIQPKRPGASLCPYELEHIDRARLRWGGAPSMPLWGSCHPCWGDAFQMLWGQQHSWK